MIDFNKGEERLNKYLGSEKKTTVLLNNELYMLKYPDPVRSKKLKDVLSYKNNQFSEHIGCSIFKSCDFNTQDTVLGDFTDTLGKSKVVVGCKDFTQNGGDLYEFAKLAGQTMVDDGKLGATIENVYNIINSSNLIKNKESIINGFWDMFVIDALIANPDRHFGNWGVFEKNGNVQLAPIYDCGSSLGALLDDNNMTSLLEKPNLFKNQEFNVTSCYSLDGKKIFYHEIFKNPPKELRESIKLIVPKISIDKISAIIEGVPQMSDIRKVYLKKAVFFKVWTNTFGFFEKNIIGRKEYTRKQHW